MKRKPIKRTPAHISLESKEISSLRWKLGETTQALVNAEKGLAAVHNQNRKLREKLDVWKARKTIQGQRNLIVLLMELHGNATEALAKNRDQLEKVLNQYGHHLKEGY